MTYGINFFLYIPINDLTVIFKRPIKKQITMLHMLKKDEITINGEKFIVIGIFEFYSILFLYGVIFEAFSVGVGVNVIELFE